MMSNRYTDPLFQLISSLEKSEKRNFKLYIKRSSHNENLKIIELFDALDKLAEYDEGLLLKKLPSIRKPQLSNIKVHLYRQLLASLRLLKSADSIDLQLNEQFDYAHILYKKGLFAQSLKILDRVKETATTNQKFNFLIQVISLEKRIETLHITRDMESRAHELSVESLEVSSRIDMVTRLSNLSMRLYSWYILNGHARNENDERNLTEFMKKNLPADAVKQLGFYERLYLYQSYTWYAFIRRDFLMYYRYSQKWINIFEQQPLMIRVETGHYIKGLHNLLNAHYDLRNYPKFDSTLLLFENFAKTDRVQQHENFRIHAFVYIVSSKINRHSMLGTFAKGILEVPHILGKLDEYAPFLDEHRILVINYKIATLYFGSGDYSTCIDYLHKIINDKVEIRNDLQCYARLLHLMAHYELGNFELMESLTKSVSRFMAKKENLTQVEEEMFKFLRSSLYLGGNKLKSLQENFLEKVKILARSRFETRAFAYLDIISWIESKVKSRPMSEIIREKFLKNNKMRTHMGVYEKNPL
ncbi:MAG: hypothetical protein ABJA57_12215 [Ginsengibacter sp.]